ncbi:MAG: S8 family serine peptidase, partial [Actinomycetota bacterium]
AGTIAARDNSSHVVGVAPGVVLHAVNVLGCNGSGLHSGIIAGVDWVTAHAVAPAVANMSLGGPAHDALDTAVRNSAARGIVYALAASNETADAEATGWLSRDGRPVLAHRRVELLGTSLRRIRTGDDASPVPRRRPGLASSA